MTEIARKLHEVEKKIAKAKGAFSFFGLFLRDDAPGLWDILVAAPWIEKDKGAALAYIAQVVQKALKPEEAIKFSRIAILEQNAPGFREALASAKVENSFLEIHHSFMFGRPIRHAFVFTSNADAV